MRHPRPAVRRAAVDRVRVVHPPRPPAGVADMTNTVAVHLALSGGLPLFEEGGGESCWRDHDWNLPAHIPRTQFERWRSAQAAYDEMENEITTILHLRD